MIFNLEGIDSKRELSPDERAKNYTVFHAPQVALLSFVPRHAPVVRFRYVDFDETNGDIDVTALPESGRDMGYVPRRLQRGVGFS